MKPNHLRPVVSAFVILIAIAACVLPGQAAQSIPTLDPFALGTAVAGTAQAAAQQTATVQPPGTVMTGTAIEQAADGTTRYNDYDAGIEITFPAGWLALQPNSEEFNAALTKAGANSTLHAQMTTDLASYQADFDRLYSYALRPDIQKNSMFGFSKLAWDPKGTAPVDNEVMGQVVRGLEAPGGIPGFRADLAQLHEDTPIKMIEIGGHFTVNDGQGGTVPYYAMIILFKPSASSAARLTFGFLEDFHAQIAEDVNSILASIKIIQSP